MTKAKKKPQAAGDKVSIKGVDYTFTEIVRSGVWTHFYLTRDVDGKKFRKWGSGKDHLQSNAVLEEV